MPRYTVLDDQPEYLYAVSLAAAPLLLGVLCVMALCHAYKALPATTGPKKFPWLVFLAGIGITVAGVWGTLNFHHFTHDHRFEMNQIR